MAEKKKHKWIKGAVENKGALHSKLGVPSGEKIPADKMAEAKNSKNPTERKEAALAETLKSFNHKKAMHKRYGGKGE